MKKTLVMLTFISILSKILGFCREILMSWFYGASGYTDIYLMAGAAAGVLLGWLGSFALIHTPLYQKLKETENRRRAEMFTNQILIIQGLLGLVVLGIFYFQGGRFIRLMANGFTDEMLDITSQFFIWAAAGVVMNSLASVVISEMNCDGELIVSNATGLTVSLSQMAVIWISAVTKHDRCLAFAGFFSAGLQLMLLVVIIHKKDRETSCFPVMKKEISQFFILIIPVFISSMMDEVNAFVDKMFGSQLPEGSISALNYAHMVKQLFFYVFALSLVTMIYPAISESTAGKDNGKVSGQVNAGLGYMYIVFSFVTIFVIIYAEYMIEIIYQRGKFDAAAVRVTSECLKMYAAALLPLAVREILVRTCQAYQDTWVNLYVGGMSVLINIVLNMLLVRTMGHKGLALSTSIAAAVTLPLLVKLTKKKNPQVYDLEVMKVSVTAISGAAGSVLLVHYFISGLFAINSHPVIRLCLMGVSFLVSGIIYMGFLYAGKVRLVRLLAADVRKRVTKRCDKSEDM